MSHTVELIAVGTELLLGNIANTDAQFLSEELSALGLNVHYHSVVGDNPERLAQVVEHAKTRADIIITTGGLGPTYDDLTKTVLAECFGKKLVMDEHSAARIRKFFQKMGREMTENNLQQAMLPEGCTVLKNDWGTAPGCAFEAEGKHVIMLPGPPRECIPLFKSAAVPYLKQLSEGITLSHSLKIFGMGESAVESLLRDTMNELTNPTLAPYAKTGEVELRITAKADTEEEAERLIAPVEEQVRCVLGDLIYGKDEPSLEAAVVKLLKEKGLTLGCAESCTGGLFGKRVTDVPGASEVFKGGVISYTNEVKTALLGVPAELLEEKGAVCAEVAQAMALGVRKALSCDLAISFTGVAGPGPDDRGNPEGLVYAALVYGDEVWVRKLGGWRDRDRIRTMAVSNGLDMVRRMVLSLRQK